jgi:uncharacterized protein YjiS (DUF1127 family)
MENGVQLQVRKSLTPFGVAFSDQCGVLGAPSQSRAARWRGDFLARFPRAVEAWRLRRRLRAQLYALSDRMLKDIGISRWEIEWIVNAPDQDLTDLVSKAL